jgi:hypothetical protein
MIGTLLRLASIACAAILIVSFGWFAADQAGNGSKQTIAKLNAADQPASSTKAQDNVDQADPSGQAESVREKRHGAVREAIDDADDVLVSPFSGIVSRTDSIWAQRGITTLLALLVFGLGLRMLAAWVPGGRR